MLFIHKDLGNRKVHVSKPSERRESGKIFAYTTYMSSILSIIYLSMYVYMCVYTKFINSHICCVFIYKHCVNLSSLLPIYKLLPLTVRNLIPVILREFIHFPSLNIESSFRIANKDHH